jgi:hypothetical protein
VLSHSFAASRTSAMFRYLEPPTSVADRMANEEFLRKLTPWKLVFCIGFTIFAGYQLYEWFADGRMYFRGISGGRYISYAEHPAWFTFLAFIYPSTFLVFGYGSLIGLIDKLSRLR